MTPNKLNTEPTISECLRELREHWPRSGRLELEVDRRSGTYAVSWIRPVLTNGVLCENVQWKRVSSDLLSECVAAVRAWHKETKQ
jgi:hypothetical protein